MKKSAQTVAMFAAFLLIGCSPSIDEGIRVSVFPQPADRPAHGIHRLIEVDVDEFIDARPMQSMGTMEGLPILARGNVVHNVGQAFRRELREGGAFLTDRNNLFVRGKILRWQVDVFSGFPSSTATARAAIEIEVFNHSNDKVYRAKYSGDTVMQHPMMSRDRIEDTLGLAMSYAMREAMRDDLFLAVLQKYSPVVVG